MLAQILIQQQLQQQRVELETQQQHLCCQFISSPMEHSQFLSSQLDSTLDLQDLQDLLDSLDSLILVSEDSLVSVNSVDSSLVEASLSPTSLF